MMSRCEDRVQEIKACSDVAQTTKTGMSWYTATSVDPPPPCMASFRQALKCLPLGLKPLCQRLLLEKPNSHTQFGQIIL